MPIRTAIWKVAPIFVAESPPCLFTHHHSRTHHHFPIDEMNEARQKLAFSYPTVAAC
jgi:hypothetical protein